MQDIPRRHSLVPRSLTAGILLGLALNMTGPGAAHQAPAPEAVRAEGTPATSRPGTNFQTQAGFEKLDSYLRDQLDSLGIPGVAVVVVRDGKQVHQAAFGRADDSGRPMTVQTPVLLASTSKSLTAIAVMQQVEAGKVALDEPVVSYLPWFTLSDDRARSITVRHLLHQASGLSSADGTAFEASETQSPEALEHGVRDLAGAVLEGNPGEAFGYSNANYNILGLLVQTVSGQPFGEYMEEHVFAPLAMAHSHTTRSAAQADNVAAGYSLWFGSWWRQTDVPAPTTGMPSTTMYSSAEDLGHELIALMGGGRFAEQRILSPESTEAILAPRVRVDDSKQYAMAWFTRPLTESADPAAQAPQDAELPLLREHQGEWGNTHTYKALVPGPGGALGPGLGVALVINANDTSAPSRLKAIDSNLLRILHGQEPQPAVVHEDWLQRNGWVVALALLLAELASLASALVLLLGRSNRNPRGKIIRNRLPLLVFGSAALALDAFLLWLSFTYAPTHFETHLPVIVRQFPDIGFTLVPALALAVVLPIPRTLWLLARMWPRRSAG